MEPSKPGGKTQDILKVMTAAQWETLEESLYAVRKGGGWGSVEIELQAGSVKYITTKVKKPV